MKLPNNYGSITQLKGRRRRPYMVRVSNGYRYDPIADKDIPKREILGYARTRKEANEMLAEYNMQPLNLDYASYTLEQCFDMWMKEYEKGEKSKSSINAHIAAMKALGSLKDKPIREIRTRDIQDALAKSGKNFPTLRKCRVMLRLVFTWCMKNDIINKDYSQFIDLSPFRNKNPNAIDRNPFIDKEIQILWDNKHDLFVRYVLIYIYTGVRASELLELKKKDIDMENRMFHIVKSKTNAGVRIVPIADKIYPFFEELMATNTEYLLHGINIDKLDYWAYLNTYFYPLMEKFNMKHTPHDTRHTCISLLSRANVNQTTIKKIIGHEGAMSLTEKVYTHPDYQELLDAINKI